MDEEVFLQKTSVPQMELEEPFTDQDFKRNSAIKNIRIAILILLLTQWVLNMLYLIREVIHPNGIDHELPGYHYIREPNSYITDAITIFTMIYIIAFIAVVGRGDRIGILICAWLGLIKLSGVIIDVMIAFVSILPSVKHTGNETGIYTLMIIITESLGSISLIVLTTAFSLKLARLLKIQADYQVV